MTGIFSLMATRYCILLITLVPYNGLIPNKSQVWHRMLPGDRYLLTTYPQAQLNFQRTPR